MTSLLSEQGYNTGIKQRDGATRGGAVAADMPVQTYLWGWMAAVFCMTTVFLPCSNNCKAKKYAETHLEMKRKFI